MKTDSQQLRDLEEACAQARIIASLFINPEIDRYRPAGPLARSANHLNADIPMLLSTLRGENVAESDDPHIRGLVSMSANDRDAEMIRNWQSIRATIAWNAPHLNRDQQIFYGLCEDKGLQGTDPTFISMLKAARSLEEAAMSDTMVVTRVMPSTGPRAPQDEEEVSTGVIIRSSHVHYLVEMNNVEQGEVFQPREVAGIGGNTMKAIWSDLDDALIETPHNAVSGRFYTKSLRDDRAGPVILTGVPEQTHATIQEAVAATGAVNLYIAQHEWAGRPQVETSRLMVHEPNIQRDVITLGRQAAHYACDQMGY